MSRSRILNAIPNVLTGLRLVAGVIMFLVLAGATGLAATMVGGAEVDEEDEVLVGSTV